MAEHRERYPQSPADKHFSDLAFIRPVAIEVTWSEKNAATLKTQISLALKPDFFKTLLYSFPIQCFR